MCVCVCSFVFLGRFLVMAHLSDDSLPTEFDVIIQGTGSSHNLFLPAIIFFTWAGLIESILAAALAKCGKSVLHLDK